MAPDLTRQDARVETVSRRATVAALLAGLVLLTMLPHARAGESDPATGRLKLAAQDPFTPIGGTTRLVLAPELPTPAPSGLEVRVTAHTSVISRGAFTRSLTATSLGPVVDQRSAPLDELPLDSLTRDRVFALGLQDPRSALDPTRLALRSPGVYPVEVELRSEGGERLDRFVTHVVVVDPQAAVVEPLRVAWIWPLAERPGGGRTTRVARALRPDGRLGRQVAALTRFPDVALTLVPSPETLETWERLGQDDASAAQALEGLREVLDGRQVLAGPYVPIDLPSLLATGLGNAVDAELVRGDGVLADVLGREPETATALPGPLDEVSFARLRARGVERMVVHASSLSPVSARFTAARPFLLEPLTPVGSSPATAVASDTGFEELLRTDEPPALRAQHVLAGLAVVAREQPSLARGVVIVNPEGFAAPADLVDALLTGLRDHPWLEPVTVGTLVDTVPPETRSPGRTPLVRSLTAYSPPAPPVTRDEFSAAQELLSALAANVGSTDGRIEHGERAILASVSSAWRGAQGRADAKAQLDVVRRYVDQYVAQIQVPAPGRITVTARSGEIPLTFRNETGGPVRVVVRLDGNGLAFPGGARREVELRPRSTTVRFAIEARTSGTYHLRLLVTSADGRLPIADTSFEVRSTFVSTVGIALAVGAVSFLALWWAVDFRRGHRRRAAAAAAE